MIKELGELNEKFYQLYGRLHKNQSLLAIKPEQIQYMATALFNQYKAEYKLLVMRAEIREKRALYDAELRHDMLVPRKSFFVFRNRAMKQLDKDILDELEAWFAAREQNAESGCLQEELPLGWEKEQPAEQNEPGAAPEQPAEQNEPGAAPEQPAEQNEPGAAPEQPAEQNEPGAAPEQPAEQNKPGAASEQPAEQTRSKKRNAAAQVPGQLSLLN